MTVQMFPKSGHIKRHYKVLFNGVKKQLNKRSEVNLLWDINIKLNSYEKN